MKDEGGMGTMDDVRCTKERAMLRFGVVVSLIPVTQGKLRVTSCEWRSGQLLQSSSTGRELRSQREATTRCNILTTRRLSPVVSRIIRG